MDVIKPVDSGEPLFPRAAPHKPAASARSQEPSTFARMLKSRSEAAENSGPTPARSPDPALPGRGPIPFENETGKAELESEFKPGFAFTTDRPDLNPSLALAFEPSAVPLPDPSLVTLPLIEASQITLEATDSTGPVDAVLPEDITVTEPIALEGNFDPAALVQPDAPLLEEINADALEPSVIPQGSQSSSEIVPLAEVEENPLVVASAADAAANSEVRAEGANSQHRSAVSPELPNHPRPDGPQAFRALNPSESSVASEDIGKAAIESFEAAKVLATDEVLIGNTASQPEGSIEDRAQPAPISPTHSLREPSDGASKTTSPTKPEAARVEEAEGLANRIGTSIVQAASGGKVLRMRLHPPELGVLQIEVASAQGGITARLDVESPQAHRAILENLPQLHEMLSRTHTQIDRIELNVLESREGLAGQSGRFGQSASDRNSPEDRLSPEGQMLRDENDSRAERESLAKSRQPGDRRSRSLPLTGIDIQV